MLGPLPLTGKLDYTQCAHIFAAATTEGKMLVLAGENEHAHKTAESEREEQWWSTCASERGGERRRAALSHLRRAMMRVQGLVKKELWGSG